MPSGENVSKCFRSFKAARRLWTRLARLSLCFHCVRGKGHWQPGFWVMVFPQGASQRGRLGQSWVPFLGLLHQSQPGHQQESLDKGQSVHQSLSLGDEKRMLFSLLMAFPSLPLSGCLWVKCILSRHRWATYSLPGPVCSSDVQFCVVPLLALWVCLSLKMFSGFVLIMIYLMI